LQFDIIYSLKVKSLKGLLLHVSLVVVCLIVIAGPYLDQPNMWLFIGFIAFTHYIQDWSKIKLTGGLNKDLFFFCLDQIMHVAFLAVIFLTDFRNVNPLSNPDHSIFIDLYNNDATIIYFISAIIASYAGHYIILLFKLEYLNIKSSPGIFEKWYGFIERICIVSVIAPGILWPVLIPVILAFRPIIYRMRKDKLNLSDHFSSKTEIILSGVFSTLTGLIFYTLI